MKEAGSHLGRFFIPSLHLCFPSFITSLFPFCNWGGGVLPQLPPDPHSSSAASLTTRFLCPQLADLPVLSLPKETLKAHSRLEHSTQPAFIHHRESLWKGCLSAW